MVELANYQGIIFDMDGTLINSMPTHLKAWEQTAAQFDFPFEAEWFYQLGGQPTSKTAAMLKAKYPISASEADMVKTKYGFYEAIESKGELIQSTHTILMQAKGEMKLAIGTGSQRVHAEALLNANGVAGCFDAVVTANDVENHKPHPETFLKAAELIGLTPSECVVFEDTQLGMRAAKAAGMDCYLVTEGNITDFVAANV